MNIFVTSDSPIECAKYLDDKRVNKMCLETAQMLCTALRQHGVEDERLYKQTHVNHPANKWVRKNLSNFMWTYEHFRSLLDEYSKRSNKIHGCSRLLNIIEEYFQVIPKGIQTSFVNCAANKKLNLDFKYIEDVYDAYKLYLKERWKTDKRTPKWYGEEKNTNNKGIYSW
jgi:hypothetical protein